MATGHIFKYMLDVFVLSYICIFLADGQQRSVCQCPDGWTYFRNSCYLFVDNIHVDWAEAIHYCQSHHAELVTVETRAEDLFLEDFSKRLFRQMSDRRDGSFWLGGSDITIEGIWTWNTNSMDIQYTNWTPGQPRHA